MGSTRDRLPYNRNHNDNKDLEIYIGNLPPSLNEDMLEEIFKDFCITKTRVVESSANKKFAFMQLDNEDSIHRAVREMNGYTIGNRNLVVRAGSRDLQRKIEEERGGGRQTQAVSKKLPNPTFYKKEEIEDDGPPPLEPVYGIVTNADEEDMPPPLELAFECRKAEKSNDHPPSLESAFNNAKPESSYPVVDCCPVTLVVANFPYGTTEDDLLLLFEDYFPLKVTVVLNTRVHSNEMTYAYVTVPNKENSEAALFEMDNFNLNGRNLVVTYILERIPSV